MSLQSILDSLSGAVAGFAFVLCGQPFEYCSILISTLKVRLQMKDKSVQFYKAVLEIFQKEGVYAFYKGMLSPLLVYTPVCAIQYAFYEYILRLLNPNPVKNQLLLKEWMIAGGASGVIYAAWVCPSEMMKCIMQMQFEYLPKQYQSPFQALVSVYKHYGISGLYKGLGCTTLRDVPQHAVFFATYEYGHYYFMKSQNKEDLNFAEALFLGGLSGLTCCMASYPMDIIKTRLQCEIRLKPQERQFKSILFDGGVIQCASAIWKQNGFRGFWTGFVSCSIYYVVGCTGQFTAYYYAQKAAKQMLEQHKH